MPPPPPLLQDLLLSLPSFRSLVLWANRQQYAQAVEAALRRPPPSSFDSLDYYVDSQARSTLQFAALHALSTHLAVAEEVLAPAQLLPPVSRVLLTTEEHNAGRYLEAVAGECADLVLSYLLVDASWGLLLPLLLSFRLLAILAAMLACAEAPPGVVH